MMPLIVKDFTWRQTSTMIYLTVKINGIRKDKTSFITCDNYIRLHFPPYYFEVFLWGGVDEVKGKCTLDEKESLVVFEMPKQEPDVEWPTLEMKDLNRAEKHEKRIRAVEMSTKRVNEELEKAMVRRQEQRQMSVHEQLRLDDEARGRIAAIKSFDTRTALEQLKDWEKAEGINPSSTCTAEKEEEVVDDPGDLEGNENEGKAKTRPKTTTIASTSVNIPTTNDREGMGDGPSRQTLMEESTSKENRNSCDESGTNKSLNSLEGNKEKPIPRSATAVKGTGEKKSSGQNRTSSAGTNSNCIPIRAGGSLSVSFTPREFPTPSRESTAHEEEEWLKKQREAMRKSGFNDADLREEERDPTWLLQKGESLMQTESYLGAVSAFTTGLKLAPKMPELFTARATSHFALSNYRKAVEDASQALEMLTPKVTRNAKERLKAHKCRGNAFYKLGLFPEALGDLNEALKLDPSNEKLKEEVNLAAKEVDREALHCSESEDEA